MFVSCYALMDEFNCYQQVLNHIPDHFRMVILWVISVVPKLQNLDLKFNAR